MSQDLRLPTRRPTRTVAPTFTAISLAEAKKQVEISDEIGHHDDHLLRLIDIAQDTLERDTGIVLCSSAWTYKLDHWPEVIELPLRPVSSVTSIAYRDTAGASQTWSSTYYTLDATRGYPVILKGRSYDYPDLYDDWSTITVTFVAGYASAETVPAVIKQALLLLVAGMFADRGDGKPLDQKSYEMLCRRIMRSNYP